MRGLCMYVDTSGNLGDLMLELAREVRLAVYPADGTKAILPVSDQDRQKLRDQINYAGSVFCGLRPWSFLGRAVSITCFCSRTDVQSNSTSG